MIPADIEELVATQPGNTSRVDSAKALKALEALGVQGDSELAIFFRRYQAAALVSKSSYNELLDPCSPSLQIGDATEFARETYELNDRFIAFTSGEGEGFILYELATGRVFDAAVDEFDSLEEGELEARWPNFFEFVRWYLGGPHRDE
jgi:hypothetical protein